MGVATFTQAMDQYYSDTWPNRRPGYVDAINMATPITAFLMKKSGVSAKGGEFLEKSIRTHAGASIQGIRPRGSVTIVDSNPDEVIRYTWSHMTGHIVRDTIEEGYNSGKQKIKDTVKSKQDQLKKDFAAKMEEVIFADTAADSLFPNGLQMLVDDTPTASRTVGGQDQSGADKTWWRPSVTTSVGLTHLNLAPAMRAKRLVLESQVDCSTDFIVTTPAVVTAYENSGDEIVWVKQGEALDYGWRSLLFDGIPLTYSSQVPTGFLYMIDTSSMEFALEQGQDLVPSTDWLTPDNQPTTRIQHYIWGGQLVCWNRRNNAVLTGITVA